MRSIKPRPKPKLTDAERHKRFVEMAREVEALDDRDAFERAFERVILSLRVAVRVHTKRKLQHKSHARAPTYSDRPPFSSSCMNSFT